jgi:hypothetical protein
MAAQISDRVFNSDLLTNEADRRAVHEFCPALDRFLVHNELIDYFKKFNSRANSAKRKSRTSGKTAIALGAIAIALAALEIALATRFAFLSLAVAASAAICGLLSVGIGAFGVLFGTRKHEWLLNRFMGERIRQFHFQMLIAKAPRIAASVVVAQREDPDETRAQAALEKQYELDRAKMFKSFQSEFERNLAAKFASTVSSYDEGNCWLFGPEDKSVIAGTQMELDPFFTVYRHLRIEYQLRYTNFKLQNDHKFISGLPLRQAEILESISKVAIAAYVLVYIGVLSVVLLGVATPWQMDETANVAADIFSIAIFAIAVIASAAFAFQLGLQPEREIEHYLQYRSILQAILERFNAAKSPAEKMCVMEQMERAAFDEMRNFLQSYNRSNCAF